MLLCKLIFSLTGQVIYSKLNFEQLLFWHFLSYQIFLIFVYIYIIILNRYNLLDKTYLLSKILLISGIIYSSKNFYYYYFKIEKLYSFQHQFYNMIFILFYN